MKIRFLPIDDLSSTDVDAMYALLNTYFSGVCADVFQADLAQKNWVLLLHDSETNQLQGFTSLLIRQLVFADEKINVVYSGDTIVDPAAWGSASLPKAWVCAINQLRQCYNQGRFYWLLICSGYRTYRFLPVFARTFYPYYGQATPQPVAELMHFLAQAQYQDAYVASTGIIRLAHPQRLRPGFDGIPQGRLSDPHIQFFRQVNPGHDAGDELVCLAEICEDNLTAAGRRIWSSSAVLTGV
ncbi:hypothetical protein IQ266_08055 [filamentous cyanobacterium LEGE 11480]|uniref:Uncharacterized protein n=1 Tax=Romeriopsis navalis LEGE 11480 TaxID=2777977 RepID=A0A928VN07_9CYAN|nr:hypothetical protein [Romeriopsis navalis]MBE9029681.1 hypothetical protein [Romeriopsis navalis LEGE 11480]